MGERERIKEIQGGKELDKRERKRDTDREREGGEREGVTGEKEKKLQTQKIHGILSYRASIRLPPFRSVRLGSELLHSVSILSVLLHSVISSEAFRSFHSVPRLSVQSRAFQFGSDPFRSVWNLFALFGAVSFCSFLLRAFPFSYEPSRSIPFGSEAFHSVPNLSVRSRASKFGS